MNLTLGPLLLTGVAGKGGGAQSNSGESAMDWGEGIIVASGSSPSSFSTMGGILRRPLATTGLSSSTALVLPLGTLPAKGFLFFLRSAFSDLHH